MLRVASAPFLDFSIFGHLLSQKICIASIDWGHKGRNQVRSLFFYPGTHDFQMAFMFLIKRFEDGDDLLLPIDLGILHIKNLLKSFIYPFQSFIVRILDQILEISRQ